MTTTYLTQASSGVPVLNGSAGSLIALLDYLLITTLGWTKAFTGTNIAAYRAPNGNRFYLGVDDTGTLNARLRGFESMTAAGVAVASGTNPFPTDAQLSGGDYVYKGSDTTTARNWWFSSDGNVFHLSINASSYYGLFSFGDFYSNKSTDPYNSLIMGEASASSYANGVNANTAAASAAIAGSFATRSYTGLGGSQPIAKAIDGSFGSSGVIGSNGATYPSTIEGGLLISRIRIGEAIVNGSFRGVLPGLWAPMHSRPLGDGDTFTGTGDLAGRTFVCRWVGTGGSVFVETSDTWSA